jgi:secreted trypsin-like serine protease
VIIDHQHILTVAHKVNSYISNPGAIKVRLGEWNLADTNEPIQSREFNVIRVFSHPQYNPNSLTNSIAILRVSPIIPLGLTPTITNACLSRNVTFRRSNFSEF